MDHTKSMLGAIEPFNGVIENLRRISTTPSVSTSPSVAEPASSGTGTSNSAVYAESGQSDDEPPAVGRPPRYVMSAQKFNAVTAAYNPRGDVPPGLSETSTVPSINTPRSAVSPRPPPIGSVLSPSNGRMMSNRDPHDDLAGADHAPPPMYYGDLP